MDRTPTPLARLFLLEFARDVTIAQCRQSKMEPKAITKFFTDLVKKLRAEVAREITDEDLNSAIFERFQYSGKAVDLGDETEDLRRMAAAVAAIPGEEAGKGGETITCLECGEKLEMITASHLQRHGMSVKDYRDKYNLPSVPLTGRNMAKTLRHFPAYSQDTPEPAQLDKETIMKSLTGDPKAITCLICQEKKGILTAKHLREHGLTKQEYLERFGLPKNTALASIEIRENRTKVMREHRVWESPKKGGQEPGE